MLFSWQCYA
ncbi:hypothetical protein EC82524_4048A, partial [Escherichia coli 8.2524]